MSVTDRTWEAPARPVTRITTIALFAEDDCTVRAGRVPGYSDTCVFHIGAVTVYGTLATLRRLAAEMTAAVDGLAS